MNRIRLTIDELTLKGFEGTDGRALVEGLRIELARVLPLTRTEWARSYRMSVLRLGPMPVETGSSGSRKFAKGLAQAIGRGIKR